MRVRVAVNRKRSPRPAFTDLGRSWTWPQIHLQFEGRNAREHGPLVFRAMQGQSDAVRASMMKHMVLLKPQLFSEEVKRDVRRLRYSFRLYD